MRYDNTDNGEVTFCRTLAQFQEDMGIWGTTNSMAVNRIITAELKLSLQYDTDVKFMNSITWKRTCEKSITMGLDYTCGIFLVTVFYHKLKFPVTRTNNSNNTVHSRVPKISTHFLSSQYYSIKKKSTVTLRSFYVLHTFQPKSSKTNTTVHD